MANLDSSYNELLKSFEYLARNFYVTRNIPIDTRFLITSMEAIDNECLPELRYPGLPFFVKESVINDGTTTTVGAIGLGPQNDNKGFETITGIMYIWEPDANGNLVAVPLHDLSKRFEILLLNIDNSTDDCYSQLCDIDTESKINCLNHLYAIPGRIVYIQPLGIAVICTIQDNKPYWKYLTGTYNVISEEQFNNIPNNLKQPNIVVNIGNERKIITSNLTLSDEILTETSPANCTENNRFYNINGFIYYRIGNVTIPVSNKFTIKQLPLKVGDNIIQFDEDVTGDLNEQTIFDSNFNTQYIIVDCFLNNAGEYSNLRFPVEHKFIDQNTINIISSIAIESVTLIFRAYQ